MNPGPLHVRNLSLPPSYTPNPNALLLPSFLFILGSVVEWVLSYSLGWPETHCVDQLTEIHLNLLFHPTLGLKMYIIKPGYVVIVIVGGQGR